MLAIISVKEEVPVVIHQWIAHALYQNFFDGVDGLSVLVSLRHVI